MQKTSLKIVLATAMMVFAMPMAVQISYAESQPVMAVKTNGVIDAPTAYEKARNGEILLIDIRSPQEWKETGVASGANKISMHEPGFQKKLDTLMGNDRSKAIAVICRTGHRSTWMAGELRKHGYTNVLNVKEGMAGGPNGKGWIPRGLPIVR